MNFIKFTNSDLLQAWYSTGLLQTLKFLMALILLYLVPGKITEIN